MTSHNEAKARELAGKTHQIDCAARRDPDKMLPACHCEWRLRVANIAAALDEAERRGKNDYDKLLITARREGEARVRKRLREALKVREHPDVEDAILLETEHAKAMIMQGEPGYEMLTALTGEDS